MGCVGNFSPHHSVLTGASSCVVVHMNLKLIVCGLYFHCPFDSHTLHTS